jgi:ADP-ribosylglycohydrolase
VNSKILGCIFGGAIGDALGAPVEFLSYRQIMDKHGTLGVTSFVESNGVGRFTDDTQMTLFTAEALHLSANENTGTLSYNNTEMFNAYQRWLKTQGYYKNKKIPKRLQTILKDGWLIKKRLLNTQRSPGITCLQSLINGVPGNMKNPINDSKGCGGVMRVAPIGLIFPPKQAFEFACRAAALTHGHPSGYLSAGFLACLISYLNKGIELNEAIEKTRLVLKRYAQHEEVDEAILKAIHLSLDKQPSHAHIDFLGGGWVGEEALSIALYCCLCYPTEFEKAVILSVNHSGDSDSTGAIAGNIMGTYIGHLGIPPKWISNLQGFNILQKTSIKIQALASCN